MKEQMPVYKILSKDAKDSYLQKRGQILGNLKKIMRTFELSEAAIYQAYLYTEVIMTDNTELRYEFVIAGCILLAVKFIQKDARIPKLKDLALFFRGAISVSDIKEAETFCIKILKHKLNYQSAYNFIEFFLQNGIIFVNELRSSSSYTVEAVQAKCFEILEQFTMDRRYIDFSPVEVACSIVTTVREFAQMKYPWHNMFQNLYSIKTDNFINCYYVIRRYLKS